MMPAATTKARPQIPTERTGSEIVPFTFGADF
jgi:hypothetical protein